MSRIEKIVDRQLRIWETTRLAASQATHKAAPAPIQPTVTVARQAGSRGEEIARSLADRLAYSFFDQEIIDYIAAARDVRRKVLDMLDEHTVSGIKLWAEGMVSGRYVDRGDFLRYLLKTVRAIHSHGSAVILGRGANYVLADTAAFRVQLVAPLETRVQNVAAALGIDPEAARREVNETDAARREFIRRSFNAPWDDPAAYDLTLNVAGLPIEAAVSLIEAAFLRVAAVRWAGAVVLDRIRAG
jgi:cytidylate kinase